MRRRGNEKGRSRGGGEGEGEGPVQEDQSTEALRLPGAGRPSREHSPLLRGPVCEAGRGALDLSHPKASQLERDRPGLRVRTFLFDGRERTASAGSKDTGRPARGPCSGSSESPEMHAVAQGVTLGIPASLSCQRASAPFRAEDLQP